MPVSVCRAKEKGTDCCAPGANPSHDTSRIAWPRLMARVGEEFPLGARTAAPAGEGDGQLGREQAVVDAKVAAVALHFVGQVSLAAGKRGQRRRELPASPSEARRSCFSPSA